MVGKDRQEVECFLRYLANEKRLSPHTVISYQRDLKKLIDFCQCHALTAWHLLKSSHIRQFIVTLHRQGLKGKSIQRSLSAVRSFYQFLIREQVVKDNPAQGIRAPKPDKRLPLTLDVDQMSRLLGISVKDKLAAIRDQAMMELFYSSGLRLAELASLNLSDIDFHSRLVCVKKGKGGRDRMAPIGRQAIHALQLWLDKRASLGFFDETALFISRQGRRLGMRSIQKRLNYWGKKQGISDTVHPHRLRHAFASHMLESSGDLRAVQELMGHADMATTQIYTHVDFQHLASVYDASHPRARKKSNNQKE